MKNRKSFYILCVLMILISCSKYNKDDRNQAISYLENKYKKCIYLIHERGGNIAVSFSSCKELKELDFKYLGQIDNITTIHLGRTKIPKKSIEYLEKLKNWEVLTAENYQISNKNFNYLCENNTKLEILNLRNQPISSEGLRSLHKLKSLEVLFLRNTKITDEGVKLMSELDSIYFLDLSHNYITDASIKYFKKMEKLNSLFIGDTLITQEGYDSLKKYFKERNRKVILEWFPKKSLSKKRK